MKTYLLTSAYHDGDCFMQQPRFYKADLREDYGLDQYHNDIERMVLTYLQDIDSEAPLAMTMDLTVNTPELEPGFVATVVVNHPLPSAFTYVRIEDSHEMVLI